MLLVTTKYDAHFEMQERIYGVHQKECIDIDDSSKLYAISTDIFDATCRFDPACPNTVATRHHHGYSNEAAAAEGETPDY